MSHPTSSGGTITANSPSCVKFVAALQMRGPMDMRSLTGVTGITYRHVIYCIKNVLIPAGKVHLSDYQRVNITGLLSPVYAAGPGIAATKPTSAELKSARLARRREKWLQQADEAIANRPVGQCPLVGAMLAMAGMSSDQARRAA